jgi:hypothetical protein
MPTHRVPTTFGITLQESGWLSSRDAVFIDEDEKLNLFADLGGNYDKTGSVMAANVASLAQSFGIDLMVENAADLLDYERFCAVIDDTEKLLRLNERNAKPNEPSKRRMSLGARKTLFQQSVTLRRDLTIPLSENTSGERINSARKSPKNSARQQQQQQQAPESPVYCISDDVLFQEPMEIEAPPSLCDMSEMERRMWVSPYFPFQHVEVREVNTRKKKDLAPELRTQRIKAIHDHIERIQKSEHHRSSSSSTLSLPPLVDPMISKRCNVSDPPPLSPARLLKLISRLAIDITNNENEQKSDVVVETSEEENTAKKKNCKSTTTRACALKRIDETDIYSRAFK